MLFSLGNLLTIAIVLVILAVYRQIDMNNRSLDKMKKYFNRIKEELDAIVEEKAMGLKDLSIELNVHEKTVKEVYNRIEKRGSDLSDRAGEIEAIHDRIDNYDAVLKELADMTHRVDDNLKKLHEESIFVDNVGRKIKETASSIEKLDKKIPAVLEKFNAKNSENFEALKASVFNDIDEKSSVLKSRIESAEENVFKFSDHITQLLTERDSVKEDTINDVKKYLDDISGTLKTEADKVEEDVRSRLFAAGDEGLSLSEDVLNKFKVQINDRADDISADITGNLALLEGRIKEYYERINEEVSDFENKVGGKSGELQTLRNDILELDDKVHALIDNSASQLNELEDKRGQIKDSFLSKITEDVETRVTDFREALIEIEDIFKERFSNIEDKTRDFENTHFSHLKDEISEKAEIVKNEALTRCSDIEKRLINRYEELFNDINSFEHSLEVKGGKLDDLKKEVSRVEEDVDGRYEKFQTDISLLERKQDQFSEIFSEKLENEMKSRITEFTEKTEILENRSLSRVEENVSEYEKNLIYRIESLENLEHDIENLDSNLKGMLNSVSDRLRDDLKSFEIALEAEKNEQKEKLENDFTDIRETLTALEDKLSELKQKAYENVNEKLQVFEDDFFADIKTRSEGMQKELVKWQTSIEDRVEKITVEKLGVREDIENKYIEDLRAQVTDLYEKAKVQFQKSENNISLMNSEVSEKLESTERTLKDFAEAVNNEIDDIKVSSSNRFNKDFAEYHTGLDEKLRQYEKDMDGRLNLFTETIENSKKELLDNIDSTRADMKIWHANVEQNLKETEGDLSGQVGKFRNELLVILDSVKNEYSEQKNELVNDSHAVREGFQNQLKELETEINRLNEELEEKSRSAIERLKNDSGIFMIDFQKKTRELEQEIDTKIKDFRTGAQEVREKTEISEKKLLGKIAESAKILNVTLEEIDKKQKSFINQTRIFERADSMKISLQEKIEDLKGEIIKVDAQSKDIKAAERKFDSIRKLGDEVSKKLNRFLAEKRRIDDIEGDFKKLLNMSQAVDIKLDQITGVYDNLQENEVKLRSFDSLFRTVAEKFERLEKKEGILETTTEGVDRNFQSLNDIERTLKDVTESVEILPMKLNEIDNRVKKIGLEKGEADKVIDKLKSLSNMIDNVEERMEKIQNAREWLARTETRLGDAGKKAEDNIKLLGSLLEKENKSKKGAKGGAPSIDKREMVVKLAHQGWSSDNIAQATGLSRGEVELILEIMPNK